MGLPHVLLRADRLATHEQGGSKRLSHNIAESMKPRTWHPVRELVEQAGIDTKDWAVDRHGRVIDNPNENVYKSFKWSFGGSGVPIALCIWHGGVDWASDPPVQTGNTKAQQDELNALADKAVSRDVRSRLIPKVRRSRDFQLALQEAHRKRLGVRVILLDGKQSSIDAAAEESSQVTFRELDPVPWYVHMADPYTGEYRMLRGVEPPPVTVPDPFAGIEDPGLDPAFQDLVEDLSETEREALIKARVGQGPFRDALIKRWGGCSVTTCSAHDLLIASHIRPWSKCTTPAQRLGAANGLLLTPNLDKLFDRGLITFDDRFRIQLSPKLRVGDALHLNVYAGLRLTAKADKDMLPFLDYHRREIFKAA